MLTSSRTNSSPRPPFRDLLPRLPCTIVLKLLQVHVLEDVYDLVIEGFINFDLIIGYSTPLLLLKLDFFSLGRGGFFSYCGEYFRVGWIFPRHCREGCIDRWLHNDANMPVVSSSLWCKKGKHVGIEELHHFIDSLIVRMSFY